MHDKGGRQESGGCLVNTCACSQSHEAVASDSGAENVSDGLVKSSVYERRDKSEEQSNGEEDLALAHAEIGE